jgi:hypothetical protein
VRAERRAWLILWVAFATFCSLVFAVVKFTVDFVSTAEIDQGARVSFSRGLVFVTAPGTADNTLLGARSELGVGTVLAVQRKDPAWVDLQLFDESKIKVLNGATVELTRMEIGRFITQHSLVITQTSGPVRYATGGQLDVVIPPNGLVQLAPHGDYTVWLDGDVTRVLVYAGDAHVSLGSTTTSVGEGRMAVIDPRSSQVQLKDRQLPLLANSDFELQAQNWQPHDLPNSRLDVNGSRFWESLPAGLGGTGNALRIMRESVKGDHGETGLIQKLDRDVSGFRHLWLRAMVRVDFASLSGGGQLGQEYPIDLHLNYEGPQAGSEIRWAVGFFYSNQDSRVIPPGRAVQWPHSEWQMYEVDLMSTADPLSVPYQLLNFAVMGQGHSYDGHIAGISLVGD